jgi:hypothetical protein
MRDAKSNLTTAVRQLERGLDAQAATFDHLSGKAAIVLGLSVSAIVAIAGLDRTALVARPGLAAVALALLIISTAAVAKTYLAATFPNLPNPVQLVARVDSPARIFDERLAASLVSTYRANQKNFEIQFGLLNIGITWFLLAITLYGAGVGLR